MRPWRFALLLRFIWPHDPRIEHVPRVEFALQAAHRPNRVPVPGIGHEVAFHQTQAMLARKDPAGIDAYPRQLGEHGPRGDDLRLARRLIDDIGMQRPIADVSEQRDQNLSFLRELLYPVHGIGQVGARHADVFANLSRL